MAEELKTPFYYVKKRLFRNKPAVFGLIIIIIAHIIAALGYLIMPDSTPNANDGDVQIQKKPMFYSVMILKIRKNQEIEKVPFFKRIYYGQESEYTIVPIKDDFQIKNDSIFFKPESSRGNKMLGESLIKCTRPMFIGASEKLGTAANYISTEDSIAYLDPEENIVWVSKKDLEKEFLANNLERRTYWLGTDKSGRDVLSRLLFGTRISLSIGFISVIISLIIGVTFGALAGFFGGKIDALIQWIMTIVWSIPSIMLVISISLALQSKGIWVVFLSVGLTMWVDIARVVRGEIMSIKQKLFIESAHALGFSDARIIFFHILPNLVGTMIVYSTSNFATAILIEAGLSFLGLGVQPPTPSWGMMINEGFDSLGTKDSTHLIVFPSLAISLLVLSFNLFGNGLRDAYDPKSLK
ncbi:MAG: ABC transporter permease [Cytophagales bacterium]|nr:ABC transporter permease [Cytophagales bacterium]MDW8384735.1 ABC transporter permease [Flammeovirgaceae bacterium]